MLAGFGIPQESICLLVKDKWGKPICVDTLVKYFANELAVGEVKANTQVVGALFKNATSDGPGSVTAQIWWTKSRMRWREPPPEDADKNQTVIVIKGGLPDKPE